MSASLAPAEGHRATPVSEADVRVKFAVLVVASLLIFVWNSIALQAALFAAMLALLVASGLGARPIARLMKLLIPAVILIMIIQGLWSPFGVTPVFVLPEAVPWLGGATVFRWEGLLFGLVVCCRIAVPLMAFQYLFATSTPNQIVLGLVRIGVPYKVAFLVSTTFRFVPFLLEEYTAIRDAQRLRGIDLDSLGLAKKLVATARLLVPLLVNCLNKAQQLEIALQARGFTDEGERTYLDPGRARMTTLERAVVALLFGGLALAIGLRLGLGLGAEVL
jgi:energy-coupling factor transport system permease protein